MAEGVAEDAHECRQRIDAAMSCAPRCHVKMNDLKNVSKNVERAEKRTELTVVRNETQVRKHSMARHVVGRNIYRFIRCGKRNIYENVAARGEGLKWMQDKNCKTHNITWGERVPGRA